MARILKKRGIYLEEKAKKNAKLAILFLTTGFICIIISSYFPFLIYIPFISFSVSLFFFAKYRGFRKGFEGENLVTDCLKNLDDSYYIINDIRLRHGNIDHIVLGPNGIFVIETKNYDGEITCNGDIWIKKILYKKRMGGTRNQKPK